MKVKGEGEGWAGDYKYILPNITSAGVGRLVKPQKDRTRKCRTSRGFSAA